MLERIKILKIGGSVLTHKDEFSKLNINNVGNTALNIRKWLDRETRNKLVFISGAGSFGHPLAHEFMLNEETDKNKSSVGFLRTTINMQKMSNLIANVFLEYNVPLFPISPSSIFVTDEGRIFESYLGTISKCLKGGHVPFLWGDAVIDLSHRYRILSGDQIASYLYDELNIDQILFGTNVDGVYTDDPILNPNAMRIKNINNDNYDEVVKFLSYSLYIDVTKGMKGKLEEIFKTDRSLDCVIYNAERQDNTFRALCGESIGTRILLKRET